MPTKFNKQTLRSVVNLFDFKFFTGSKEEAEKQKARTISELLANVLCSGSDQVPPELALMCSFHGDFEPGKEEN